MIRDYQRSHSGCDQREWTARKSSEMFSSPRSPSRTMGRLLFRRILSARLTPNVLQYLFCRRFIRPGFSTSLLAATMNQKSSLREDPQCVSWVLMVNTLDY
jgi:hypothetical protein